MDHRVAERVASEPLSGGSARAQAIGDIFHSEPQVRPGVPSDFLQDFELFGFCFHAEQESADTVLYVSTNDGFLHAFTVNPGEAVQNSGRAASM